MFLQYHINTKLSMAPRGGFEPPTNRLTVDCATAALPRNMFLSNWFAGFPICLRVGEPRLGKSSLDCCL